jgi:hypothetical protein
MHTCPRRTVHEDNKQSNSHAQHWWLQMGGGCHATLHTCGRWHHMQALTPGATALTLTPQGAHSTANDLVMLSTPARAAPVCLSHAQKPVFLCTTP